MGPDFRVDDARRAHAVERIEDLLGGNPAHVGPRFPGHTSGMRARQHIVELKQRMVRRRRLLGPDVETRACNEDRKSTRLNSSHANISYAVFCLKKKKKKKTQNNYEY